MENTGKPKRTISKEQLQKMKEGRERKKAMMNSSEIIEVKEEVPEPEEEVIIEEPEEQPEQEEVPVIKKGGKGSGRGAPREQMIELNKIRKAKADERKAKEDLIKAQKEQVKKIKEEKLNIEYQNALKIKERLDKKKIEIIKNKQIEERNDLYQSASKEAIRSKYLEEARKRVLNDLFSS
jgi:hypothetical protein